MLDYGREIEMNNLTSTFLSSQESKLLQRIFYGKKDVVSQISSRYLRLLQKLITGVQVLF